MEKTFMKGNEAIAEAAVQCGCRFFFGYPITPQNEIPEYFSKRLPEVGGTFCRPTSRAYGMNISHDQPSTLAYGRRSPPRTFVA